MTNEVKELTEDEIKALASAQSDYKAAEVRFKLLKDTLTTNITIGKHIGKSGIVTKAMVKRQVIDYKKLLADHPEIDVSEYTTETEYPMVTVTPLVEENKKFSLFK